ncbi:alpha/beta hydrolase [Streptomyces sp. NPDC055681]
MVERTDVVFEAEGRVALRGWFFIPDGSGPHPGITMAHGFAGVKEHGLEPFARAFAEDGFAVLAHDHRTFGASDGEPRQDVDPWQQITDWRRAVTYLESRPEVDADRIGLWGTSYAGGHAIVMGATDRRLRAVVSQVPTTNGYATGLRRVPPEAVAALEESFAEDERGQFRGEAPRTVTIVSADPSVPASYRMQEAIDFYLQPTPEGAWENRVTVRSTRVARMYEPGRFAARVSPTPLLMVVGETDTVVGSDLALATYERALEPKRLQIIRGGHFDPYVKQFDVASGAARAWFREHLTA